MKIEIKALWLSRHEMTDAQRADLLKFLRGSPYAKGHTVEVTVAARNVTWAATADASADRAVNRTVIDSLEDYDCLLGVFPPVAMEAHGRRGPTCWLSPVSRQEPAVRVGDGPIPFAHVRWAEVRGAAGPLLWWKAIKASQGA